jgi:hypothetical protein
MDAESLMPRDEFAPEIAIGAPELLREFSRAGVLAAADVHVARTLAELAGVDKDEVLLALALAVRAPRLGHVFVDLTLAEAGGGRGGGPGGRPVPPPSPGLTQPPGLPNSRPAKSS